jgi:hypothetical protein
MPVRLVGIGYTPSGLHLRLAGRPYVRAAIALPRAVGQQRNDNSQTLLTRKRTELRSMQPRMQKNSSRVGGEHENGHHLPTFPDWQARTGKNCEASFPQAEICVVLATETAPPLCFLVVNLGPSAVSCLYKTGLVDQSL